MAKLNIGFKGTCSCTEKHLSCITAKEWAKAQKASRKNFYETII